MCAPWIEHVLRRVLNLLELFDPLFSLVAFFLRDLIGVELLLQLLRKARRFFFRLEAGAIDRPMTRLASIHARHDHVVHLHEHVGDDHLIDFQCGVDEIEHRQVEDQIGSLELDRRKLLVQQVDVAGENFPFVIEVFDFAQPDIDAFLRSVAFSREVLQPDVEIGDVLLLPLVLGLLLSRIPPLLNHRRLGDISLSVEACFGEAIVLIGGVVNAFPAVEIFLRAHVL